MLVFSHLPTLLIQRAWDWGMETHNKQTLMVKAL